MTNNPVGSVWKKWDLHVHTPSSIIHNYPGDEEDAWENFLRDLEALPSEFKVIGINDYIFVDGYERARNAKLKQGRLRNIELLLPVIELRLDKFAGVVKKNKDGSYSQSDWNRINLHVIFDEIEPETIRQQFISAIAPSYRLTPDASSNGNKWHGVITRESLTELGQRIIDSAPDAKKNDYASPLQEGFNNLCVSLDNVHNALNNHYLEHRHLIAIGKTEWANLKWDDQSIAEKRNIINQADLVFTSAVNPAAYYAARDKLLSSNVNATLLDCSDAHALSTTEYKDRVGNCFTWIKADPTFEGLRQALTEFDDRVFVGDTPPKLERVNSNRTKYITRIRISRRISSSLPDRWFDVDLPLNHDLVAIIGNKGSGKSALADITALVGDTKNYKSFSFLNERRFRNPRGKLASQFAGELHWHDGTESKRQLDLDPLDTSVERVKYLPQLYLETLCNELGDRGSATFDAELRKIIYTHVPDEDRLGCASMDELLAYKVAGINGARAQAANDIAKINLEIERAERRLTKEFKQSLERKLDAKEAELKSLKDSAPAPVEDPAVSETAMKESMAATARIQELENELKALRDSEKQLRDDKGAKIKLQAALTRIVQEIDNYKKIHERFIEQLESMLTEINADFKANSLIDLRIDISKLDTWREMCKESIATVDRDLLSDKPDGLVSRREALEASITSIKSSLDEKQRKFLVFKEQMIKWERDKEELVGRRDKPESIEWLKAEIDSLAKIPEKLNDLRTTRRGFVKKIHGLIGQMVEEYRHLYRPVQQFVKTAAKMDMPLPLDFDVRIEEHNFQEQFLSHINRQVRGSFSGIEESAVLVRSLLNEVDFGDIDSTLKFLEGADDKLHFDRRVPNVDQELEVSKQLRRGSEPRELYDFLYCMNYLVPRYSLTFDQQEIGQLSPGERGLLLLVFYLLVDKDDIPIVIDQPEENLDNQTIYKVLVKCIKAAKDKRQVIMVTHNPNLAVVCDAEQIICATCNKVAKTFSYVSGAIESQKIKMQVVDVLEGTEPAFKNRELKYGL